MNKSKHFGIYIVAVFGSLWLGCTQLQKNKAWFIDFSIKPSGFFMDSSYFHSHETPNLNILTTVMNKTDDTIKFNNKKNDQIYAYLIFSSSGFQDTILFDTVFPSSDWAPNVGRKLVIAEEGQQFIRKTKAEWRENDSLYYYDIYNKLLQDTVVVEIHFFEQTKSLRLTGEASNLLLISN